jgi:hypothetical protein
MDWMFLITGKKCRSYGHNVRKKEEIAKKYITLVIARKMMKAETY